ncbi:MULTISPECIES: autotransporter outer membrane beta-barrel domain-containing protein [unclassified Anaerobiospirillum]|uniref:autotransporter outer membrane beta-barrel domain-containing protein n=1 Tax=unclassified Anaerobiospirillum TaxID=2647410 RepID=UPI001FF1298A|nr:MULTISPECIES: autotransporter outer membrane beta-barrel domain-containing protein [unclassified Anaerobiospirillum]MCK0534812.1 autotransporter domain-containing protein [Anaerobiospirillum sp. NML120511]MCK0539874.1 autotransporter domain-containing protein [Anaerobiospirillum sp. NML02-A-032]
MKQTNSTLTFLSAQYRAVMKDAYLKGLASTALLSTAAMGSIYASTADAAPTDLNDFKDLAQSGEVSYSKDAAKEIAIADSGEWNAKLSVTNGKDDGVVFKPTAKDVTVNGTGSLTVSSSDSAVVTFGDAAQNYEFAMNIESIDVQQGKIQIKAGQSGARTSVAAKNITIGTADTSAKATGTHLIDIQGKSGAVASLGNATSQIALNSNGAIHFNGENADAAVLNGQITGKGGAIEFKQNGTFKAGGKTEGTNFKIYAGKTAVFDFDAALAKVEGTDANLKIDNGNIEIVGNSGGTTNAGTMHIKNGNVHLTAKLVGKEGNSQLKIGDGNEAQSAKLTGYWGNLTDYLNAKAGNKNNSIEIEKDGTLEVKLWKDDYVTLGEFAFSDKLQAGKVKVADGATVQADKLHIGSMLIKDSGASEQFKKAKYINIKASTLKLSEPAWKNGGNEDYGFKQATTEKLEVVPHSGSTFNLLNEVNVVKTTQIDNPYVKDTKVTVGADNTLDGEIQVDAGGKLVAAAGNLTANGKLKVDAGTLQVGGAPASAKVSGVDASLIASGGLEIMNQNAGGTVQVLGNGALEIPTDASTGKVTYESQGKLDLTKGDLTVTGHASNFTTFKASNGTIALNQKNADELLNTQGKRSGGTAKGAAVELGNNGVLDIQGDLHGKATGDNQYAAFDANNITKHTGSPESDMISFSGTGNTVIANNAHLAGEALQIGAGNTLATRQALTLDSTAQKIDAALDQARNLLAAAQGGDADSSASPDAPAKAVEFQLRNGTVSVGTALKTNVKDQILSVTHDESTSATLELGQASLGKDRFGQLTQSGSAGVLASHSEFAEGSGGTVDMAMKLDGLAEDKMAALKVKYGKWTAKDITASKGLIEIGSDIDGMTADKIQYGKDGSPVLNAQTVTLADGSKVIVNVPASGSFDKLDIKKGTVDVAGKLHAGQLNMADGSNYNVTGNATANSMTMESGSTVTVSGAGNMVVAQAGDGKADAAQYAFTSKDGSAINVTGHRANFTIGAKGLDGLKLENGDKGLDPDNKYAQNVTLASGGTLTLGFESGTKLSSQDLINLKKEFLKGYSGAGSKVDGALDIGKAVLTDIGDVIKDGRADWNELEQYVSAGSLDGVINEQLSNTTVYNVGSGDRFSANVGSMEASGDVVLGNGSLNNAGLNSQNNFIADQKDPSKVGNATLDTGAHFAFKNGGNVGEITMKAGDANDKTTMVIGGDTSKTTNIAAIKGAAHTMVDISATTNVSGSVTDVADLDVNASLKVGGDVTADRLLSSANASGTSLTAKNLTVKGAEETRFNGDINVTEKASFAGKAMLGGSNTFGSVEFKNDAHLTSGKNVAQNVTIGAGKNLFVGTDGPSGTSAVLAAQNLQLNGGTIYADPEYGQEATMVLIGSLGKQETAQLLADAGNGDGTQKPEGEQKPDAGQGGADQDKIPALPINPAPKPEGDAGGNNGGSDVQIASAGRLDGNIHALKNSIVALGVDTANLQAAVDDLKNTFAPYMKNGSLQDPSSAPGAVGAIAYVAKPITVANGSKIVVDAGASNTPGLGEEAKPASANTADTYIGKNSALAMSAQAVSGKQAAVTFEKKNATIYADDGAKVLLTADGLQSDQSIKLFADADGTVTLETAGNKNLAVQSVNGLFEVEGGLAAGEIGDVKLTMNQSVGNTLYHDASDPIRETINAYNNTNGTNELLNKIKYESKTGRDADSAARLAAMGGAVNAALTANRTTTDAVAARMGVGVGANAEGKNISSLGSTRGSVWATPVYTRGDSKGMEAQGQSYGNKTDMYGMAVGADYRVSRDVEVGAVVNVGKGEVTGKELASNVSNDVSYMGAGVYSRFKNGDTSVVGDLTYTQADNDLSSNLDVAPDRKLSAAADTKVISAGVTAKRDFNVNGYEVSPHAGARFSHIKTSGHDVKMGDNVVASYSSEAQNVVSIPVGVTVSRNINSNGWNIKPSADVHVTANLGDTSSKGEVSWTGTKDLRTNVETEVIDRVTYGAAVGVSATRGNFTAGAGVSYNGSSSSSEVAVGANVRYDF